MFAVSDEVALGTEVFGVDGVYFAVPEGEVVVVLAGGDDVFSAGFFEEEGPGVGVEFFGGEEGDEVLVAEGIEGAEFLRVPGRVMPAV